MAQMTIHELGARYVATFRLQAAPLVVHGADEIPEAAVPQPDVSLKKLRRVLNSPEFSEYG